MAPLSVYAITAGGLHSTIASLILSLLLQCGVAPTNSGWLASLNAAYGVESSIGTIGSAIESGLITETATGALVDTGLSTAIASAPEYTSLGISEIFASTAADAAAGSGIIEATAATNLANTAINVGTLGTIGAFAGAVTVGAGLGYLIHKAADYFAPYIMFGIGLDSPAETLKNIPAGVKNVGFVNYTSGNTKYEYIVYGVGNSDLICHDSTVAGNRNFVYMNATSQYMRVYYKLFRDGQKTQDSYSSVTSWNGRGNDLPLNQVEATNFRYIGDIQDYIDYQSSLRSGAYVPDNTKISNDLIGPQGNYTNDMGGEGEDYINTPMLTENEDMYPIPYEDYEDYVDIANNNTENGDTDEETQGVAFTDFVDDYIITQNPSLYPDGDRPAIPTQPTTPTKPTNTPAETEQGLGMMTPDLRDIFPFCIPFDIYNIIVPLKTSERRAPHITWNWTEDRVIDVDLSVYDDAAAILRTLELILFTIGLALAARKIIGAGG